MSEQTSTNKKFFTQSSHYFLGTLTLFLTHFISFPIFTRLFSVEDYGILGLITVTISTVVSLAKLGFNNSAIRFYSDCRAGNKNYDLKQFYSTFFWCTVLVSLLISIVYCLVIWFSPTNLLNSHVKDLLFFTAVLVFLNTTNNILKSFFRAEQKTKTLNLIDILTNYSSIGFSVVFILWYIKGLYGFYTGQIMVSTVLLIGLIINLLNKHKVKIKYISGNIIRESLKYGLPLMGLEFLNHILTYSDRYLIQFYHGAERLGIYTVGYNLSQYLTNLFLIPISLVITPILMETWTNKGERETQLFLTSAVKYFLMVVLPVVFGFVAISHDLIPLLATRKYMESEVVIPYVVGGIALFTLTYIFNSGLTIYKKTGRILGFACIASIVNIVLNVLLIPQHDIIGAAYATLISYLFFFLCVSFSSFRLLKFSIPVFSITGYVLACILMVYVVGLIQIKDHFFYNLLVKIMAGIFIYSIFILISDGKLRKLIWQKIS